MEIPTRVCAQNFNEVICLMCTFNNLHQKQIFKNPEDFILNYKYLCNKRGIPILEDIQDKTGIHQDVLNFQLESHGYRVIAVPKNKKHVGWGFAIFNITHKGFQFYHIVAIVHNYVVDSIRFEIENPKKNPGVYPWNGTLQGYHHSTLESLWKIERK
jgi:hypothetical protein